MSGIISSSAAEQVADKAINIMAREMTDRILSLIQDDRALQKEYLDAVSADGLQKVNHTIAVVVKDRFGFESIPDAADPSRNSEQKEPKSKLLQSYTEFRLR
ncbi:MAG: hypothetical protein LBD30_02035 [Verrucomicrobiales bacterium]|jgi:hypothetical protein|nr:hypothetical protein [Verrucomicrobiales bacterium]